MADNDSDILSTNSIPSKDKQFENEVIVYTSESLEDPQGSVSLSWGALILFALLCGGDYDQGIEKCGSATAFGLARCGFGDKLLEAVQNIKGKGLDNFLVQWRIELQHELESNSRGMLHSCQPQLARQIPDTFPNQKIIELYVDPLTSEWSAPTSLPLWKAKDTLIVELVKFCIHNFHWEASQLRQKFTSLLWEGIFLQMLYSVRQSK